MLYKYLPKKEFISTWLDGGIIPLKLASSFFSTERSKTQTPDENRIINLKTKLSDDDFNRSYKISTTTNLNIQISGNRIIKNGILVDDGSTNFKQKMIDGYVMSFSTKLSRQIANKFEMPFVIKITDLEKLKNTINAQISLPFSEGLCSYTSKIDRCVFLKGIDDEWQREYRFFWKVNNSSSNEVFIEIPKNIAKQVKI